MQRCRLYRVHKVHARTDGRNHSSVTISPDQRLSLYCVHKLISIDVQCDLDLWPLTSKINRVHPLITVNMSCKFDKEICNGVDSIAFTRSTHGQTDGTTEPQQRDYIPTATCCAGIKRNRIVKHVTVGIKRNRIVKPTSWKIDSPEFNAWLSRKCDYRTDRRTHRQTPDKVIPMCRYASQATQKCGLEWTSEDFGEKLYRNPESNDLDIVIYYIYYMLSRITDEGSLPEMRTWSILLIKSDLKWCIHLSRSLFIFVPQAQMLPCL